MRVLVAGGALRFPEIRVKFDVARWACCGAFRGTSGLCVAVIELAWTRSSAIPIGVEGVPVDADFEGADVTGLIARREMLRRSATVVGATVLWTTPVVQSLGARPAAAGTHGGDSEEEVEADEEAEELESDDAVDESEEGLAEEGDGDPTDEESALQESVDDTKEVAELQEELPETTEELEQALENRSADDGDELHDDGGQDTHDDGQDVTARADDDDAGSQQASVSEDPDAAAETDVDEASS